ERFTRSAFFATTDAASLWKKSTPATIVSVVTTSSQPRRGAIIATSSVSPNAPGAVANGAKTLAIRSNSVMARLYRANGDNFRYKSDVLPWRGQCANMTITDSAAV